MSYMKEKVSQSLKKEGEKQWSDEEIVTLIELYEATVTQFYGIIFRRNIEIETYGNLPWTKLHQVLKSELKKK